MQLLISEPCNITGALMEFFLYAAGDGVACGSGPPSFQTLLKIQLIISAKSLE
jgi:hypothetical protein